MNISWFGSALPYVADDLTECRADASPHFLNRGKHLQRLKHAAAADQHAETVGGSGLLTKTFDHMRGVVVDTGFGKAAVDNGIDFLLGRFPNIFPVFAVAD